MGKIFRGVCLFLSLAAEAFCTMQEAPKIIQDKATLPILTPSFQDRKTCKIELQNGLQAYIISDPNISKSAATLVVKTGSWEDPIDYPGIAHFLEHMLFLGTEKYPIESDYNRYISEHDGMTNAFTSNDFTGYVFTVDNKAFPEALDRFAQFFITPLFNPSGIDRELQAIDQEYAKNIENDDIREYYVSKTLGNALHPNKAFNMGNKNSLLKVSQKTLKEWYKEHYSADRMKLEIISPLPLSELKSLVVQDFSGIQNLKLPPLNIDLPLNDEGVKGHMVYIEPIKNKRRLSILFELPKKFALMRDSKPEQIVSQVLGAEGKFSLLAQLKKEKLAEVIRVGGEKIGGSNYEFYIQVDLTDAGVRDVNTVILRCFQAIANFKEKGVPNYLFDEKHTLSKLNYQFQPKEDLFDTILTEAMLLPDEELDTYPEQTKIIQKFDPAAVMDLLNLLTPQNAIYNLMAPKSLLPKITFDRKEVWLHTAYAVKAIPKETLEIWEKAKPNPQIELPAPNSYIPDNFLVLSKEKTSNTKDGDYILHPVPILDNEKGKVFFSPDNRYAIPKLSLSFEIKTPMIDPSNPESDVLADLFVKYAEDALNSFTYPAAVAGLNFSIQPTQNGLAITLDGFSDKADELFFDILKTIKNLKLKEQKFKSYKDALLREYQDASFNMPLLQDFEILRSIQYKNFITSKAKTAAIRKVNFESLDNFAAELFSKTYVEGMIFGNTNETLAKNLTNQIIENFQSAPYLKQEQPIKETIVLPQNSGPYFVEVKSKVQGNAVILMIEPDKFSFKARAAQQLLMQAIKEPFFRELRTKQQTGYIVLSQAEELEDHLYNTFAVQSNTHDGRDLLARFEEFIETFLQEIAIEVNPISFENIKQATLATLKEPPQNMTDMTSLLYKLAFSYHGDFDRIKKRIKALEELSYEDFVIEAKQSLGKKNKRRLAILLNGTISPEDTLQYEKVNNPLKIREMSTYER